MGSKRRHSHQGETEEDRKKRKRSRKEAKKRKKSKEKSDKHKRKREPESSKEDSSSAAHQQSVFWKKKLEMTVSLLPGCLGNVQKSVKDSLSLFLLKYSDGVGGILLAFDNMEIMGDGKGFILNELPYIHYQVTCDALVFCPTVGCKLTGIVTESFHSHLSLVVHHYFNASVPAELLRASGFDFDADREQWYRKENAVASTPTNLLSKGDQVEFVVEKVHESGGIISLDGSHPSLVESKSD